MLVKGAGGKNQIWVKGFGDIQVIALVESGKGGRNLLVGVLDGSVAFVVIIKMFGIEVTPSPKPDKFINVNEKLKLGNSEAEFIFTPGHTPGGATFVTSLGIFPGDAIFAGSIGRTDLPGGDYDTLIRSIKTRILSLDDDTRIFPGHGPATTVGRERTGNPFLVT